MTRAWRGFLASAIAALGLIVAHPAALYAQEDNCTLIRGWLEFLEAMLRFFEAIGDWESVLIVWIQLYAFLEMARSLGC